MRHHHWSEEFKQWILDQYDSGMAIQAIQKDLKGNIGFNAIRRLIVDSGRTIRRGYGEPLEHVTPEEIEARKAEIQAGWEDEREHRAIPQEPPEIMTLRRVSPRRRGVFVVET